MAVEPGYRRSGLGTQLKLRQRDWCLAHQVTAMRWTFDPLQLNNAHLNLCRLGAIGVTYHVNHYGALGGINGSLPSDRLTVRWELSEGVPTWREHTWVDVPAASADDIASSHQRAVVARMAVRQAMQPLVDSGWRVTDVDRTTRRYTLSR
jgi:predicted GNAT superfamily acetyltransferase